MKSIMIDCAEPESLSNDYSSVSWMCVRNRKPVTYFELFNHLFFPPASLQFSVIIHESLEPLRPPNFASNLLPKYPESNISKLLSPIKVNVNLPQRDCQPTNK